MYCIYRNSSWYIHGGPLYGGGLLLGGSVIGGSTVFWCLVRSVRKRNGQTDKHTYKTSTVTFAAHVC